VIDVIRVRLTIERFSSSGGLPGRSGGATPTIAFVHIVIRGIAEWGDGALKLLADKLETLTAILAAASLPRPVGGTSGAP
jgi:hypothetical protein